MTKVRHLPPLPMKKPISWRAVIIYRQEQSLGKEISWDEAIQLAAFQATEASKRRSIDAKVFALDYASAVSGEGRPLKAKEN